jgi:hypothetical protein
VSDRWRSGLPVVANRRFDLPMAGSKAGRTSTAAQAPCLSSLVWPPQCAAAGARARPPASSNFPSAEAATGRSYSRDLGRNYSPASVARAARLAHQLVGERLANACAILWPDGRPEVRGQLPGWVGRPPWRQRQSGRRTRACCLALAEFGARRKDGDWEDPPGDATELTVEVLPPTTTHVVKVAEVKRWLETAATDPAQSVAKSRLKRLLG